MSKKIELRPYYLKDLAAIYGVHRDTFKSWLVPFIDKIGPKQGRYYSILQVTVILDHLGIPKNYEGFQETSTTKKD